MKSSTFDPDTIFARSSPHMPNTDELIRLVRVVWTKTQIVEDCLRTMDDGSGKFNLVQLARATRTVIGSLRSIRVDACEHDRRLSATNYNVGFVSDSHQFVHVANCRQDILAIVYWVSNSDHDKSIKNIKHKNIKHKNIKIQNIKV